MQSKDGFNIRVTNFVPVLTDENLKVLVDEVLPSNNAISLVLPDITTENITDFEGFKSNMIKLCKQNVAVIELLLGELIELRDITRRIQKERDFFVDYLTDITPGKVINSTTTIAGTNSELETMHFEYSDTAIAGVRNMRNIGF